MNFQVFARENCELCKKAQDVLSRAGVVPEVRYVEGTAATPENLADFAWYDWTDTPPLVIATDGDRIGRHQGRLAARSPSLAGRTPASVNRTPHHAVE